MGSLASLKSFMVALLHTVRATDSHKSGFLKYNGDNSISGTKLQHWFPKMKGSMVTTMDTGANAVTRIDWFTETLALAKILNLYKWNSPRSNGQKSALNYKEKKKTVINPPSIPRQFTQWEPFEWRGGTVPWRKDWYTAKVVYTFLQNSTKGICGHFSMWLQWGNSGNSVRLYFSGLQNHCRWWLQPWN